MMHPAPNYQWQITYCTRLCSHKHKQRRAYSAIREWALPVAVCGLVIQPLFHRGLSSLKKKIEKWAVIDLSIQAQTQQVTQTFYSALCVKKITIESRDFPIITEDWVSGKDSGWNNNYPHSLFNSYRTVPHVFIMTMIRLDISTLFICSHCCVLHF